MRAAQYGAFIGPDKAGSSWFHALARWHPEVDTPAAKDLFFFDRYYHRGVDWYERQFHGPLDAVRVEVCHDYLFSPPAAARMRACSPTARLVVCLRDPVERAVSAYLYMRRQGRVATDFETALRTVDELCDHGDYARHLAPWVDRFGTDAFLLVSFDDLRARPGQVASGFFRHLSVSDLRPPKDVLAPRRQAARARNQLLATTGKSVASLLREVRLERAVGALKSSRVVEQLIFRPLADQEWPRPSEADVAYIAERIGDQSRRLRSLGFADENIPGWA